MVGTAGFEPTTLCPPGRCATRLRYAPTLNLQLYPGSPGSALEQEQDFLELLAHLLDDLGRDRGLAAAALALEALAGAGNGVALLVQQTADLPDHQHIVALVIAAVAAALDRGQGFELGLPIPQHVRLDVAQLADLTNGEVALRRDR